MRRQTVTGEGNQTAEGKTQAETIRQKAKMQARK